MVYSLRSVGGTVPPRTSKTPASAMVVGSGGTTRAAVYALHSLGYAPIYVVARSPDRVAELARSFPAEYALHHLAEPAQVAALAPEQLPDVVISTIPADRPIDPGMREVLVAALRRDRGPNAPARVLLEMAYTPRLTPLMQLAEDAGWRTIPGLEVLTAQGWYQVCFFYSLFFLSFWRLAVNGRVMWLTLSCEQFQLWTGITPLYADARAAVMGSE